MQPVSRSFGSRLEAGKGLLPCLHLARYSLFELQEEQDWVFLSKGIPT
jgi:hypothetical protein